MRRLPRVGRAQARGVAANKVCTNKDKRREEHAFSSRLFDFTHDFGSPWAPSSHRGHLFDQETI